LHGFNFENGSINPLSSIRKYGLELEITDVWIWNEKIDIPFIQGTNYSKWVSLKYEQYLYEYYIYVGPMDNLFRLRNNSTTNFNEILQINLDNIRYIKTNSQGPGTIQAPLDDATKYKVFMNVKDANQGQGFKQIRTFSIDVSLTNVLNIDN